MAHRRAVARPAGRAGGHPPGPGRGPLPRTGRLRHPRPAPDPAGARDPTLESRLRAASGHDVVRPLPGPRERGGGHPFRRGFRRAAHRLSGRMRAPLPPQGAPRVRGSGAPGPAGLRSVAGRAAGDASRLPPLARGPLHRDGPLSRRLRSPSGTGRAGAARRLARAVDLHPHPPRSGIPERGGGHGGGPVRVVAFGGQSIQGEVGGQRSTARADPAATPRRLRSQAFPRSPEAAGPPRRRITAVPAVPPQRPPTTTSLGK